MIKNVNVNDIKNDNDAKLEELHREMKYYLLELVQEGCPICDSRGYGYEEFPITGKVCEHMIKKREMKFGKKIDSFIKNLLIEI